MKTNFFVISIILVSFLLSSCEKIERPPKYFSLDGKEYTVGKALLEDWGTNNEITHRTYKLSFRSHEIDPNAYFDFRIYSNSTTRIQEGVYTYEYEEGVMGTISYTELGVDIEYDEIGERISGNVFTENNSTFEGTITINRSNDNYDFIFDLTIMKNGQEYSIAGQYNAPLTEGEIY